MLQSSFLVLLCVLLRCDALVPCLSGTMVGFVSSLLFKTKLLRSDDRHSPLEANIVILFAFASYFIADGVGESGIVAVLFCGMVSRPALPLLCASLSRHR